MRYSSSPACVEARESVSDAALDRERIALHRNRCGDCRAHAEEEEGISRSLHLISERPLDDLARARIQSRLAGDFDRMAAENARGPRSKRIWIAGAIAAALLLWLVWPKEVLEPAAQDRLIAYLVTGTSQARLAPGAVIEAGPGMTVRAEIEGQGEVTLVGPGRALRSSRERIVLERGLLLVHVQRRFEVSAGEVTVRVLGTRFAVDRRDPAAAVQVSVSEGVVEVSQRDAVVRLGRGQAWPVSGTVEERLSAAELEPPRGPSGVVVIGGTPAGAIAMLDGVTLGPTPLIARLAAGEHRLEVQADLHQSHLRSVAVPEEGVIDVSFALEPSAPSAPAKIDPAKIDPAKIAPRPAPRRAPPPPETPETAETLYRRAEASLAAGRAEEAQAVLEDLVARFAGDPLVDSALYELARLAYEAGRLEEAHERLLRLLARRDDADFAESGQRLLCQIDLETRRYDDANACWRSFRDRYPASVHDPEALASLIALAQIWNDCPRVKSLAEEFLARYPTHALTRDVEARLERCAD